MIEGIFPASPVAFSESFGDRDDDLVFDEERRHVERAVAKRRREFVSGRSCAHEALTRLGLPAQPIGVGDRGQPLWPAGCVGSITHCDGYRACVAARERDFAALGIDAEPNEPLPTMVPVDTIGLPEEARLLADLRRADPDIHWDRLLFSAKEATYKAWFALTGERPGFHDARLEFDRDTLTLQAHLLPRPGSAAAPALLSGRWLATPSFLLTAVAVPTPAP